MNNEDKRLIADYMWWYEDEMLAVFCITEHKIANFDLNNAGLCVREMQKRGDLDGFKKNALMMYFKVTKIDTATNFFAWLFNDNNFFVWMFNADNFFEVMAKWLKEEKK